MSKLHTLKVDDATLMQALIDGTKKFEFRRNDRGFAPGDVLMLNLWNGKKYLPLGTVKKVGYVVYGPAYGVPEGYCVMSLLPCEESEGTP